MKIDTSTLAKVGDFVAGRMQCAIKGGGVALIISIVHSIDRTFYDETSHIYYGDGGDFGARRMPHAETERG